MGCDNSSMAMPPPPLNNYRPPHNFNNNNSTMFYQMQNAKRPKFLNDQQLNQQQKNILWSIVQKNSLKQFAYFIENQRIPSNIEIGPSNTFWNFAHFCARWDAFQCLHYMIKKVYSENPNSLRSLMNQQTIEGFTAIHVAIQWNSINCFYLMIDHGGIDLSYTDKSNNDVFSKASLFKRSQMLELLQRFKAGSALMIIVQSQKARGFQEYAKNLSLGQIQVSKQYKISQERINEIIDTKNRLNRPPPPLPLPKQTNLNSYENHYQAMKQIQQKRGQNSIGEQSNEQQMRNRLKMQQQRRFQQQQKRIKNNQAIQMKRALQLQKQQEQRRLRQQIQQQINQQRVYQEAELKKIQKQRQIIRNNIQAMQSSPINNFYNGKPTQMICPQDVKQNYLNALSQNAKYLDHQFPPQNSSLGSVEKFKFQWRDCHWLRPQQIFNGSEFQVFDGISPEDIKQGTLGVCYYLALLSSIAEHEQRIKRIFKFYDKNLGFYAVQLYLQGKPITMIVDDSIPCMKGINQPLFSRPRSPEVWVMILQKAWVKMFGSYLAAQRMSSVHMFENVLPAPCRTIMIDVSKIDQSFDRLVEFDFKKYIMTASSKGGDDSLPPGIVAQHEYSLISAYNINGLKLCKIRNPWGKTQYQGMYNEQSPLWTPQLRETVQFKQQQDGIFFLTSTQLQAVMPMITVSYYKDFYEYSYIEVNSKSNQEVYFVVNVKKKGQIAFKVTQQNQRFKKNMEFENAPIRFQLCKLEEGYQARIISQGEPSTMYGGITNLYTTQNVFEDLDVGRYMIRLKVLYDRAYKVSTRGSLRKFIRGTNGKDILEIRQGRSVLSMYGPESYVFNRISKEEGQKYMKNVYKNYINERKSNERLRSVGQDLKAMVTAKDINMRNQIIYMAENHMEKNSIDFKFKFDHTKFRNCSYAYNVDKENEACQWVIEAGGWNLGTLEIDCPFQELATDGQMHSTFKIIR